MGCVNRSSNEFKALAARHNLATNTLELITHKYWLETGNETLFPTDVYIQAQIGNSHYIEKGNAIRTLWNKRYSSSQEFSSFREFEKARREASKFFPQSAIVHYRNSKDNFVLSVKRPVEKADFTKDSFFDEMDNIGSMRDVKVLNLNIEKDKSYSIDKVQELYNRFNTDRTSKELADKVFSIAKDLGLSISFNESLPFGTVGRYTNNNTIVYKKSFIERDIMNDIKAPIILHEVLHALSMYALSKQTKNWKRPQALEQFRTEMNSLYQDLKNNPILKNERGVVDLMEFVAELANPVFRNKIKEIDKQNKANKSFWSRVLDAFKSLLGLHTTSSYYQRSIKALDKALDAFDLDTYMRYNGIKSTLREGYNAEEWQFNSLSDEKLKAKVKETLNKQGNTQLNNTLDVISKVAESGKWTSEALTALDNLVTDIENGKVTYQRFPQEASRGMYQGGRANAAASLLLRGSESTSSKNPRTLSERYERDKREQPVQERIIEAWAKAANLWHDNLDTIPGKSQIAEGGEAKVFYNSGEKKVIKILSTAYFITPQFALDRITLHNTLFPDSALKVIGFGRNSQGEFQFIVEQPFIQGTSATQKKIDDFISKIGFTKPSKDKGNTFTNEDLYISDLHDENVIKTSKGNLVVIDADLRLNTPELNRGGKYEINNELTQNNNTTASPLKPQYQGKLIYAQSGTGKSTIADNKTVFDSDYILGSILGVSTETAGFFFKTLSAEQKKVFGEQYRNAIRQMVAEGYTVLTANESLLPDADVVVYNQSPEQTDERVNSDNRALTNRYHAPEYHQNTLSKIQKLKDEDKENSKEYVSLDGEHYLSDVISSGNNLHDRTSNLHTDSKQKESNALLGEQQREHIISSFLNEFGISVNLLDNYDGKLPLFDALNRVINARSESDITDGVGYAIAFMMQGDPEIQRMVVASHGMSGDFNKRVPIINKTIKNLHPNQHSPVAKEVLREIGRQIASELRENFGTPIEDVKSKKTIWKVIKNFFTRLGMRIAAFGNRKKVLKQEGLFVKDIIEALGREDFTRIKGPRIKEGSTELAQRVDVEQALKDNPFEDGIIRKLGEHGIALAGSTSIALQGALFRPSENPLHDIDFNASDNSSKESLDKLLPTIFPNGTIQFSHALPKGRNGNQTVTYVHLSEPFTIKKTGFDTAEFYNKDGKYLGKRVHYDLFLEDGVQGKLLDFFTGPKKESEHGFYKKNINGHEYLLSESNAAMAAKILWARPKDMWDYKNFKRDDFSENTSEIMDIRRKAISDGTFMKAPNGKQTNLSERQWLQVRTKAFKEWFGDWENNPKNASKVVDENGEPLVVYHSTRADFNTFDLNKSKNGEGLWFKPWRDNSTVVGKVVEKLSQSHDMPVYLNIKNPVIVDKPSGYKSGDIYTREGIDKHSTPDNDGAIGFSNMNVFKGTLNISDIKGKNGVELVVFNPNQVKSATDNIGTFSTADNNIANYEFSKDFINSLSGKDLKQELELIKQESADYDMLNNIESEQKKSKKTGPQDFTFDDGTKVKAPFKPNSQQVDALNEMDRFMKSKETSMTLSGYAGTGKTSLMEIIAKKGRMQHKPVMFCASTNKAAAVLNERVSKAGFKAETLNKVFGISVEVDSTKAYNAKNLINVLKDADIRRGTTVIIDEASMINEENYNILNKIAGENNLKIIYVGDEAQLAPVGEDRVSKVFRNGDGKVIRLTQVERTDDNAILKEATDIRNGKPLSGVSSFNEKGEGVAYISPQHQDAIGDVIQKYVQGLKSNPNYFRVLAFTNKAVSGYNSQIRELLGYDTPTPQRGEPMTGYANWGYNWRTKSYRFINSEAYKVTLIGTPRTVKTTLSNCTPVFMKATPITLEDPMGNTDTFDFMDIKGDASNRNNAALLANEKKMLWAKAKQVAGRQAKAQIYQKINEIDSFLFVNDSIVDDKGNTLQNKIIDFGYAMTVHKSQGSTFTHVLIDDVDISKAGMGNNMANVMEVVDLGEDTSQDMSNVELRNSEDVDLGDLSDVEVEESQPNQAINLKQQLEYVGVSRATDTVTIVSNKIKKEGSPLHPEQSQEATTPLNNNNNNESNTTGNEQTPSGQQQTSNGGLLADTQARIQRRSSNGRETQKQGVLSQEDIDRRNKEDRELIEKFAKEQGKWVEDVDTKLEKKYGEKIGHGSESWVYLKDKDTVIKSRSLTGYDTIQNALRSIELHNSLFPETAMKVVGFGTSDGEFTVVFEQPYIGDGIYATNEEIENFIKERFNAAKDDSVTGDTSYKSEKYLLQDLKPQNVLVRVVNGEKQYQVIDGDFYDNPDYVSTKQQNNNSTQNGKEYKLTDEFRRVQEGSRKFLEKGVSIFQRGERKLDDKDKEKIGRVLGGLLEANSNGGWHGVQSHLTHTNKDSSVGHFNVGRVSGKLFHDIFETVRTYLPNGELVDLHDDYSEAKCFVTNDGLCGFAIEPNGNLVSVFSLSPNTNKGFLYAIKDMVRKEGATQRVSLPSYEYFNDLYEDTPVDAGWKIPYLKELDNQLSMDNSEEENTNIINQMDMILQATSETEYKQEVKDSKKKSTETVLTEYEKLIQQFNNLLDSDEISASEIRHTAELVVNEISDEISRLNTEEGLAKELFPSLDTDLDFLSATRKQIVETIGINRLIDRAKKLFSPEISSYDDLDTMSQAWLITDNWDAIMTLASDIFAMNEGFGITKDYSKGNFTTIEESKINYDNFNDYSNDPDIAAEEGEKDEQEHWQVESRTIDVLNSMSALVRQGIHKCYQLDAEGNKIYSKWGIAERVNPREAVNSILRWSQGALSLDDMIQRLSDKQKQNPWLSQLIERLSDKSGKETDFQSQFYGVFAKHFQLYSVILQEDGKYYSMAVNSHPALSEAMQSITSLFKIGEHPLFSEEGKINTKLLGSDKTIEKDSDFNLHKALKELRDVTKSLKEGNTLDDDMSKIATANIVGVCRSLGYNVTEEMLSDIVNAENIKSMTESLMYIVKELEHASQAQSNGNLKDYNPFAFGAEFSIGGKLRNFFSPITDKLEDTAINAFYDSGKMYQSYVTPSFMTKFFKKFHQEGQAFEDFILDEYGSSEWFKFNAGDGDITKGWRNEWLRILAKDPEARSIFDHKVELNFNKHNYMRNMSDAEYTLSLITEYFSESSQKEQAMVPAWFRVPIQSNKPSSEFIKFYSYRGNNYKDSIVNGLHNMFLQELSRIQTVLMRNLSKNDPEFIKNFDTNGRKFCLLPVFNAYLENSETAMKKRDILRNEDNAISSDNNRLATLLQKRIKGEEELTPDEVTELNNLADRVIRQSTENRLQSTLDSWESNGILEAAKSIKGIYPSELKDEEADAYIRSQVENFLWNDSFAAKNILQLTVTDIAFSKDTEDLQKRLAQLHAPGIRGNIFAIDYNGNRVSDGKYRTFILQDFDTFKSNIIANISEVFDRRIANAPENQKAQLIALKESLIGKNGKYTKINVTDAQGYSSPSSYRKKALIFGKWSKQAEDIYQKLSKGEYTYTDLETTFQPLKPFVYSKLTKNLGVPNAPIQSMQVPFQAKNAEYLLIMADAILKGEKLSHPNLLRAVYRVMEDSEKLMPTKGIDTVQFESAIKSGLQGKMDLHQFREMEGGEEAAYTFMMNQIFKEEYNANERVYRNYNTDTFVHETSYDNYCLQQEVPEHFKEHSQAHGSQIRMIIPSDLDSFTFDENGNQVENFYEWTEPDGTHRKVTAKEFRKEYEQTIADNIEESINNLAAELHFSSEDKRERNIALSKILQREILSSPRYGVDLIQACSIDRETGEFRIPKGDPIQAKRIEQLINSIIKNRINKQKIAGGPIVQVSNFGTSQQLHIRFNDKQGNLMPLENEYIPSEHDNLPYKEYIKKNQGGIAYFEVYAPIWSNELFEKFSNLDGSINVEAINKVNPELLKMVSYRIPTEDKYSCAPMKVVGFMPREAGDAIMFPYELTEIDDSDFDVDKRYTMRKDIHIKTKRRKDVENELFNIASESYKNAHDGNANNKWIGEQVRMFLDNPQKMKDADKFMQWLYSQYQQVAYYTDAPTSGRTYRDNKIIDMTLAVLTNPMTADKILNPGGFDAPKKMGYMVAAYKNPANEGIEWSELQKKSIDELKDLSYTEKDLTFADTQVQFYKQNAAAASLIGVFAVNKVAHATLESNDILLDVSEICGEDDFTIANTTFGGRMQIDAKYDREGNLIGKTLGSLVSASADAVKDPILNLMNINMTTAGMLNTMLRLGMTFEDAALFLSQSIIERTLNQFNRENLTNYESLDSIIEKWLDAYRKKYSISDISNINTEPLTTEELIEGLTSKEHDAIDYKVLLAFQKMRALTDAMRKPTFATRFNSISSAVGPLIVDNLIMEHKMEQFLDANSENGTHFYTHDDVPVDIDDIFFDHPILKQFSRTVDIAKALFSDMPTGSTGFRNLLKSLPEDIADKMYNDKKLLDQFSNFYQSYLLIQSGVINHSQLKDYALNFPKWFSEQNFKEKYEDNALIQAIRLNVSKKTGRPFLQINITGMDEQAKEELRNAWIDLHKADPELSQMLFNYSFFRAGIGFSPKTFMALVPTYVKERLQSKDGSASYVNTYRNFPTVIPDIVIDQFIRNNWNNNKLVPMKGGKGTHYDIDTKKGRLLVYRSEDMTDLAGLTYIKTKNQNGTYLWHLKSSERDRLIFELISPLGNNGEYLEMSTSRIDKPLSETLQTSEESTPSEIKTDSPQESAAEETSKAQVVTSTEQVKNLSALADLIMLQNPKLDKEGALKTIENIKKHERMFTKFLQNVFKHKGLDLNEEEVLKEFRKYC